MNTNLTAAQDARAFEQEIHAAQQSQQAMEVAEETAQACDDLYVQIQDKALADDAMATAEVGNRRAIPWEYASWDKDGWNTYQRQLRNLEEENHRTC